MDFSLDAVATLVLAIIVLFIGDFLTNRIQLLKKYHIPSPVTGGILVSIFFGILYFGTGITFTFSDDLSDVLLIAFFVTVGLSAKLHLLFTGGKLLAILLAAAIVLLIIQNVTGILGAILFNMDPHLGMLSGSISLTGGHGTAASFGKHFIEQAGVENALEVGLAVATFGLIMGGLLGGPLATRLINKNKVDYVDPEDIEAPSPDVIEYKHPLSARKIASYHGLLETILIISLCIVVGEWLNDYLRQTMHWILPQFVTALFVAVVLTNLLEFTKVYTIRTKPLSLCSSLSLDIFLATALMKVQLWTLSDLAGPLFIILVLQVFLTFAYVYFVVSRIAGKDYTSSVISAGFIGFGLGATQTAMANMRAVTKDYGACPVAFLVIPLIGAFFIDIVNTIIIQSFLLLPIF